MNNVAIAETFDLIADLLEFQDANPFRVRAYRNAARTVRDFPEPMASLAASTERKLTDIPGIGKDIAEKIVALCTTGKLPLYLALGRFVLASDVGEAALVLPPAQRVPYHGLVDPAYPARLADRVRALLANPGLAADAAAGNRAVARERFDYDMLAARVGDVLDRVLSAGGAG